MDSVRFRPMTEADIDAVLVLEQAAYEVPWTAGIFADCLRVGYSCWVACRADQADQPIVGYALLSVAADEAHILNLCVSPDYQGHGLGSRLLKRLIDLARWHHAHRIILEVRQSNAHAAGMYERAGFQLVGKRKGYYQTADGGREDAVVMILELGG